MTKSAAEAPNAVDRLSVEYTTGNRYGITRTGGGGMVMQWNIEKYVTLTDTSLLMKQ